MLTWLKRYLGYAKTVAPPKEHGRWAIVTLSVLPPLCAWRRVWLLLLLGSGLALAIVPTVQARPGDLDPTFGVGGVVITDLGRPDGAGAITLQPDGKILVAGSAVVRYTSDGRLDPAFGAGGAVITDFGGSAIALQPDGKILVAGGWDENITVVRYTSDGRLDLAFGAGGVVITDLDGFNTANAIALQADGKILVAGTLENPDDDIAT